jgi:hypothetical protein
VKAFDDNGEFSLPLPVRFQEVIDEIAMREGEFGSDAYMEAWNWGESKDLPGSAEDVVRKIISQIDAQYPQHSDDLLDFIRNTRKNKELS